MCHVEDYLFNLRDLNYTVASSGQAFQDEFETQLPNDIINMVYMFGPIPLDDYAFL
jgi:hypothetical protein